MYLTCFISADLSLGRVDKASLPQETLMELLIEKIANKHACGTPDDPTDLSDWNDLELNAFDEIVTLDWDYLNLEGSIQLQWLPFSLRRVFMKYNHLAGTVNLTRLPDGLETLDLADNLLEGTIDVTKLPASLQHLFLDNNKFVGKVDFGLLPKSLKILNVEETDLEGDVFVFYRTLEICGSYVKDMQE